MQLLREYPHAGTAPCKKLKQARNWQKHEEREQEEANLLNVGLQPGPLKRRYLLTTFNATCSCKSFFSARAILYSDFSNSSAVF